jgi:hypothetical protein
MYHERVKDLMEPTDSTASDDDALTKPPEVRLLFRSWIYVSNGVFEDEVHQHNALEKLPTTALWLAYMEAVFHIMTGAYMLSEDESIILGCLKMQAESGDYSSSTHIPKVLQERVGTRFPPPVRDRMRNLVVQKKFVEADAIAVRIQTLYARLVGKLILLVLLRRVDVAVAVAVNPSALPHVVAVFAVM